MSLEVRELTPVERKKVSDLVIGITTCPHCTQSNVAVINDRGPRGDSRFNYLENHYPDGSDNLCVGSEKMLHDFD